MQLEGVKRGADNQFVILSVQRSHDSICTQQSSASAYEAKDSRRGESFIEVLSAFFLMVSCRLFATLLLIYIVMIAAGQYNPIGAKVQLPLEHPNHLNV